MDVIKTLHRAPSCEVGVHYPLDAQNFKVEKLFRKPSNSVMGQIYMFDLLKSLLPRLVDTLDLKWLRST